MSQWLPSHVVVRTGTHGASNGRLRVLSSEVRAMLRCIRHRAAEPLTVRGMARDLGRQPEYVGWLFRHETGTTFRERLTTIRMRRAARLIRAGVKIQAVAVLVGYRSKKNFYDQFRRRFGVTAGEYRQAFDVTQWTDTRVPDPPGN